jgi:putative protease
VSTHNSHAPELLAPAGDWEALRAAVANGADAVYFGLSNFNARHRAANFTLEELPEVVRYLHDRNVRGYVTVNTLIFSDELPEASRFLAAIAAAGADAVIVQDLGLARLIQRLAPGLPVHGSTQMTLTEPRGIEFVRRLGVERVILARELSVAEIGRIAGQTEVPLEVFVHGALCVAYSGQCLTSEAVGGRSANRGQCAQACRLPYELRVDGVARDLGGRAYLLSPQDLAAFDLIDPLVRLGVCCFKIEGRLKSAQYVAVTTQTYRAALSAALAQRPFALSRQGQLDLAQSFSRGLTHGFLDGVNHQQLVQGRFPKSRGVRVGTVRERTAQGVIVDLAEPSPGLVKPGDGVVFDEGHPEQDEQGGRVYAVKPLPARPSGPRSARVELTFGRGDVNLAALAPGSIVWKTDDPALRRRLERSYAHDRPARRLPVSMQVEGRPGQPLRLAARVGEGEAVEVSWPGPLERAVKHPLTVEVLREQLGRLGETPFELQDVTADLPEPVMVPRSVLNDLRRQVVARLSQRPAPGRAVDRIDPGVLEAIRREVLARPGPAAPAAPRLYVLARTLEQLDAVLAWTPPAPLERPALVYCDFEDVRRYREAVARARAAGLPIGLATLRIVKPGEEGFLRQIAGHGPDALLVRNLAGLTLYREEVPHVPLVGDFALNVANEITADLLAGAGLVRLVPSYDLNWEQLAAMLGRVPPGLFEVVIHQHMPMFHRIWLHSSLWPGRLIICGSVAPAGGNRHDHANDIEPLTHRTRLQLPALFPPRPGQGRLCPPADQTAGRLAAAKQGPARHLVNSGGQGYLRLHRGSPQEPRPARAGGVPVRRRKGAGPPGLVPDRREPRQALTRGHHPGPFPLPSADSSRCADRAIAPGRDGL